MAEVGGVGERDLEDGDVMNDRGGNGGDQQQDRRDEDEGDAETAKKKGVHVSWGWRTNEEEERKWQLHELVDVPKHGDGVSATRCALWSNVSR